MDNGQPAAVEKITEQERRFVDAACNLSDAQVYLPLSPIQEAAIPGIDFLRTPRASFNLDAEKSRFLASFARFHRGLWLPPAGEWLFGYSASMLLEVFANALRLVGRRRVGLLHPTYDATFHILVRNGLTPFVVEEADLAENAAMDRMLAGLNCLVLTLPNNPTGWTMTSSAFEHLTAAAARAGTCLLVDSCFRTYAESEVEHYRILVESGAHGAVIEDTGKLFNIKDLKLGAIWVQGALAAAVRDIHRDFILEVPLFTLVTLCQLLERSGPEYGVTLRSIVARNRAAAVAVLGVQGLSALGDGHSNVQLFSLPWGLLAEPLREAAVAAEVGIVAANPYFWSGGRTGEFIRLALAREEQEFAQQLGQLGGVIEKALHES